MIKRELTEFWTEFREEYLYYAGITLIVIAAIFVFVVWVCAPLLLSLFFSPWWLLVYLITIPALITTVVVANDRGYIQ